MKKWPVVVGVAGRFNKYIRVSTELGLQLLHRFTV